MLGFSASATNADEVKQGTLILIGGVLSLKERVVWTRIAELAGREVVVVSAANERPRQYGNYAVRGLTRFGLSARLLPVAVSPDEFNRQYREATHSPELVKQVRDADTVYFVGGAPQRLAKVLFNDDGSATPLAAAVDQVYAAGGVVIGGIPEHSGAHTGIDALHVLEQGRLPEQQMYRGLGLVENGWYVDQHFFVAGRFAEALVSMRQRSIDYGIGVGPNAAAVIKDGELEVLGEEGVVLVDLSRAKTTANDAGFNLQGARLSYLGDGDRVDLATLQVTPHESKLDGFEIHPGADDHQPLLQDSLVTDEVLAGNRLRQLLLVAMDGEANQTIGFAFRERNDRRDRGFKFRFYSVNDTVGWLALGPSGERYTALNIHLDIASLTRAQAAGLAQ